jgi:phage terminase large subunit-like protein
MIAIGTPKGKGWFWQMHKRGQNDDEPEYQSFQAPTYENPFINSDDIDEARDTLPDRVFRQEYLAQFVEDTGGVFTGVDEHVAKHAYTPSEAEAKPPHATGVDLARQEDYTVITTLNAAGRVTYYNRLQAPWNQIQNEVQQVYNQYEGVVAIDATRDNKLVADLERAGVNIKPVKFTSQRKADLVENLVAAYEAGEVQVPDISQLVHELKVFEYETTRAGNLRYSAPEGMHDDCVDSLALAEDARRDYENQDSKPKPVFGRSDETRQRGQHGLLDSL